MHFYKKAKKKNFMTFRLLSRSTPGIPRQPTRLTTTNAVEINRREYGIPIWEHLATDQTDPWQVVPREVYTPYDCLLISVAFVVLLVTSVCRMKMKSFQK